MLAASSIDDIIAINMFSLFLSLAFSEIGATTGDDKSIAENVLFNIL